MGAVIDGSVIKGEFGYGEIQRPKNEKLVMVRKGRLERVAKVAKIIITKSVMGGTGGGAGKRGRVDGGEKQGEAGRLGRMEEGQ